MQFSTQQTVQHYENFLVASFLLPRHLRRPVGIIYAFARAADKNAGAGLTFYTSAIEIDFKCKT